MEEVHPLRKSFIGKAVELKKSQLFDQKTIPEAYPFVPAELIGFLKWCESNAHELEAIGMELRVLPYLPDRTVAEVSPTKASPNAPDADDDDHIIARTPVAKNRKVDTEQTALITPSTSSKVWCEAGEHLVDSCDHWSSQLHYESVGDCMDCTS